ncbi:MAG TPA: hypothetical protein VJN70_21400, partial [Gemmatimonadaceae bacterium]|nr:hypothetical protein [Gemmatimonadaceae bacterium]
KDGAWTDLRPAPTGKSVQTVRIKAFSKAYFDLIDAVPELRAIFAVGDKVTAQGRAITLVVSEDGKEQLSATEVKAVADKW